MCSYTFLTIRNKLFIAFQKAVHWNVKYISEHQIPPDVILIEILRIFLILPFFLFLSSFVLKKSPVQGLSTVKKSILSIFSLLTCIKTHAPHVSHFIVRKIRKMGAFYLKM